VDVLGGEGRDELAVQAATMTSTPKMTSLRIGPARFEVAAGASGTGCAMHVEESHEFDKSAHVGGVFVRLSPG
jgi:hypothetical protein